MNLNFQIISVAFVIAVSSFSLTVQGQMLPAGPQVLTFFSDMDDTEQPYGLYLPENYNQEKKYPLVVMLHGAGSNHRLALRRVFGKSNFQGENDVEASRYFPELRSVDYIVVTPYARGTAGYKGIPEKDVYDILADVKGRFNIDEDRVYLTGLSMGGGGTLWLGLSRPDVWAAIAPVCPAPPKGTEELVENALNYPVHIFHGDADPVVKTSDVRNWVKNFKASQTDITYTEYPGVMHDSWVNAYADGYIFDWFEPYKRNLFPDRVRFTSRQYKYNKAYWVSFDAITPGTLAKIDAKFSDTNKMDISTEALDAFSLNLKGHSRFAEGKIISITIDGKKVKVPSDAALSFSKVKGKWIAEKYEAPALSKEYGSEGPLFEAFTSRHVYVYGTKDNPSAEELRSRIETALQAANWSMYRGEFLGRIKFFPRVIADKEVRSSDLESANLILFGTSETNSVIEQYKDRLPVHLKVQATKDHGLFYIFPVNGKYVAVNSGLPWWTNAADPQGFSFISQVHGILSEFKDFILFKESQKNIITEGYFTNVWDLSHSALQSMKASGVITFTKDLITMNE